MALERHDISVPLAAKYLLQAPAAIGEETLVAVALHGYGFQPEPMLRLTAKMLGPAHVVAALQGPNQFYLAPDEFARSAIGYAWGTRHDPADSLRLHHDMVLGVLSELQARFGIGPHRALLVGFSQPVSMNYRLVAAHPGAVRGVIAICGGLPSDWEQQPPEPLRPAVLHLAAEEDRYYPLEVAHQFARRLRQYAADVEFRLMPGGHRVPSNAADVVRPWLARVFPAVRAATP